MELDLYYIYSELLSGDDGFVRFDIELQNYGITGEDVDYSQGPYELQFIGEVHKLTPEDLEDWDDEFKLDKTIYVTNVGELSSTYNPRNTYNFRNTNWSEYECDSYESLEEAVEVVVDYMTEFITSKNLSEWDEVTISTTNKDYSHIVEKLKSDNL